MYLYLQLINIGHYFPCQRISIYDSICFFNVQMYLYLQSINIGNYVLANERHVLAVQILRVTATTQLPQWNTLPLEVVSRPESLLQTVSGNNSMPDYPPDRE